MAIFNIPLPPPLYFFLGQNYSENVFEFVNHFDSPYPSTFAGKFTLCQKTVLLGSSYNLLSCQCLSGSSWGLTALGTQHRWPRGKAGQESRPQHLLGSDGLCDTAQTDLPLWLPWKSPGPVTSETERGISHQARGSSSSGCGFQILGECLEFWFSWKNLAFSARPLKVQGVHHGGSDLPPRKFCLWLWWKCDGSEARNAIQRLDSLQPGYS